MKIRIPVAYDENGAWCARASSWTDEAAAEKHVRDLIEGAELTWVEVDIPAPEVEDGGRYGE